LVNHLIVLHQQLLITHTSEKVFNEVSFEHLPNLRHLAEVDVNEVQCQQLLSILETLTMYVIAIDEQQA